MLRKHKHAPATDVMLDPVPDRRLFAHVPDPTGVRKRLDRRDDIVSDPSKPQHARYAGKRYTAHVDMRVTTPAHKTLLCKTTDLSQTGAMLQADSAEILGCIHAGDSLNLDFQLLPGMLQEGTEKRYRIKATVVRTLPERNSFAVQFAEPLYENRRHTTDTFLFSIATLFLFIVSMFILLMRIESVVYFEQNRILYGYSIVTAAYLLTRYLFGMMYKPVPVDRDYTPGITIVIPCFNEQTWIARTIISCIDQDYPPDKLHLIIVDDGSGDNSVAVIKDTVTRLCREGERFHTKDRIRVFLQKTNQGKREAMGLGIRNCKTELVAFVDSDSFLEPDAVRNLVQPMYDPKMGGVTGRTDVVNTYTNGLTKLQSVRYYISFRVMKAAEATFDSVMCLSGPLSCYRLSAVNEVFDAWLHQTFLGQKATFGDDRSLTNYIVQNHRTYYQDTAICSTIVPSRHKQFLKQQMRWKRSWLRESLKAGKFMWRKEPLMSVSFYIGLMVPLLAPIIVVYNLVYVPLTMHIFPTTFLLGLLFMSLMMSFTQLLMKRSSLWFYGVLFCLYYEAVLLWQMPWAWFTFWVSDWGTRSNKKRTPDKPAKSKASAKAQAPAQPDASAVSQAPAQSQAPAPSQASAQPQAPTQPEASAQQPHAATPGKEASA